jgi:2-polyprenyl-3-methyl-5-hydroxy-6-metoxy-1,4-benzoquinol methylase
MAVSPDEALTTGRAFGIDPTRPERYSLRQSRYEALASDISAWAGEAARRGETLFLLDIGCGWGPLLRYLDGKPNFDRIRISGADLVDAALYRKDAYEEYVVGDLTGGYPEIPSGHYDIVVCEQVLEHLDRLDIALDTLVRVLRPGGTLVIGVPIFLPPLHLARKYLVPLLAKLLGHPDSASHQQAFSMRSFLRELRRRPELTLVKVRGFRIISGGLLRRMENYRWWWRLNRRIGELVPAACIEIQIILKKTE